MTRYLFNVLFFLMPFAVYWVFVVVTRRIEHQPNREWADAPFGWLVVAGLVFAIGSMVVLGFLEGLQTNDIYEPARLIDGKIQSGGMRE